MDESLDEVCDQCWEGEPRQEKQAIRIVAGKGYCAAHLKELNPALRGGGPARAPAPVTPAPAPLKEKHGRKKSPPIQPQHVAISLKDSGNRSMREVLQMLQRERDDLDLVIETLNNILLRRGG